MDVWKFPVGNSRKLPKQTFLIFPNFPKLSKFPDIFKWSRVPKGQSQPLAVFFLPEGSVPWHFCCKGNSEPVSVAADKVASGSPPRPHFTGDSETFSLDTATASSECFCWATCEQLDMPPRKAFSTLHTAPWKGWHRLCNSQRGFGSRVMGPRAVFALNWDVR